jgi:hypothetical protein
MGSDGHFFSNEMYREKIHPKNRATLGKTKVHDLGTKNEAGIHGANVGEESRKTQKTRGKRAFLSREKKS